MLFHFNVIKNCTLADPLCRPHCNAHLQKLCPATCLDDARKLLLHMMSFDTLLQNYGSSNLHFVARTTAAARRGALMHASALASSRSRIDVTHADFAPVVACDVLQLALFDIVLLIDDGSRCAPSTCHLKLPALHPHSNVFTFFLPLFLFVLQHGRGNQMERHELHSRTGKRCAPSHCCYTASHRPSQFQPHACARL